MGKKRIVKKSGGSEAAARSQSRTPKKKVATGVLYVEATFNNTKAVLTDTSGNAVLWSSSGTLGFKGAKKGTPFAAGKVGEVLAERAEPLGLKEVHVVIRGVGSGREPVVRSFIAKGYDLLSVKDETPVPHNGPKPKKPRRV